MISPLKTVDMPEKTHDALHNTIDSFYSVQQDLIRKVVPTVVQILRETIAKEIFFSMKSGCDISVRESEVSSIRNALIKFVCVGGTSCAIAQQQSSLFQTAESSTLDKSSNGNIEVLESDLFMEHTTKTPIELISNNSSAAVIKPGHSSSSICHDVAHQVESDSDFVTSSDSSFLSVDSSSVASSFSKNDQSFSSHASNVSLSMVPKLPSMKKSNKKTVVFKLTSA